DPVRPVPGRGGGPPALRGGQRPAGGPLLLDGPRHAGDRLPRAGDRLARAGRVRRGVRRRAL
ncbi:MAG: 4-hydroxyphenylpyruvate dioxygenase, partial [uncultured Nocardioidaceae bacterium]